MSAYTVNSYASLLPDPRGKPTPEMDLPRAVWTATRRRNLPGPATDNRYAQADAYIGTQYIAIERIADGLAGAAIQILHRGMGGASALTARDARRGKDWTPAEPTHPAVRLFEHVNPVDTLGQFLRKYTICKMLFGGVFLYVVYGRSGKPVEVWAIPPQYVLPGVGVTPQYPFGSWRLLVPQPMSYGYTQAGMAVVDARQLIFDRKYNPRFEWDAYSPLKAGALQIDLLRAVNEARKEAMDKGCSIDMVVVVEGASEDELRRLRQQHAERYTGTGGERTLFTGGEGVKAAPLGIAPKEMAFEQGYDQLTNFVLSLFGVPHGVAGLTDAGSFAAYYASLQQFRGLKLQPEADEIAAVWTKHLIRPSYGDDYKLVIELAPVIDQDDLKQRYSALLQGGGVTVNEERAAHNLDPLDGGDVPLSVYTQVEQQKAQPQPQPGAMPGGLPGLGGQETNAGDNSELIPGQSQPDDAAADGSGHNSADGQEDNPLTAGVLQALGVQGGGDISGSAKLPPDMSMVRKAWTRFTTKTGGVGARNEQGREIYGKDAEDALAAQANPRHNPDLDDVMGMGGGVKPAPAQQPKPAPTDLRHNPDLDDVFDPKPPATGGGTGGGGAGAGNSGSGGGGSSNTPPPPLPPQANAVANRAIPRLKPVAQQLANNPQARQAAANLGQWAQRAADAHADLIAKTHDLDRASGHDLFLHILEHLVRGIPGIGKAASVGIGALRQMRMRGAVKGVKDAAAAAGKAQKDADAMHKQHAANLANHEKATRQHQASADRLADAGDRLSDLRDDHAGHVENLNNAKAELDAANKSGDQKRIDAATKKHAAATERHKRSARQLSRFAKQHQRLAAKHKELTQQIEAGPPDVESPEDVADMPTTADPRPRPQVAAAMRQAAAQQGVLGGTSLNRFGPKRPKVPGSAGSLPPRLKSLAAEYVRKVNKSLKQGG